ncbi:MAG: hypothetical protein H6574_24035 [Lewinellaceae bacterium]|nr:hypothetical protein [Saprospiraceae bacterium]MCB9334136.1 hypothetical protein [Lewinellaceae bacterium]
MMRQFQMLTALLGIVLLTNLPAPALSQSKAPHPKSFPELRTPADFDALKGKPINEKYGQVESVKVIWDLKKDKLHFISAHHFKWHYDYCRQELGYWQTRHVFNARNYSTLKTREFVLANINHYPAAKRWTVEFSSADDMTAELASTFMQKLRPACFMGDSLGLFLNTEKLVGRFDALEKQPDFPLVTADQIYAGQVYQALNTKSGYGYLRRMEAAEIEEKVPGMRDIVVLNGSALDIPAVAGLMTTDFQTPLSHLNVLCKNRGTPFFAQKNIYTDPRIVALENELVFLEVLPDSFRVRKAEQAEAAAAWSKSRPKKQVRLRANTTTRGLQSMSNLSNRSVNLVGGKASNFAVLQRIAKSGKGQWIVPEGAFAIPFAYYVEHMRSSGADSMVQALLKNPQVRNDPQRLSAQLELIYERIRQHPVNPELLRLVEARVRNESPSLRMRFRSSTNAEDIEGFNGAGLYDSGIGIVGDSVKTVENAIRKVWASVWNFRAFQEREFFGIDQENVAMGVLVHRSFPDEKANGVAITKNLYRKAYYGFVINVQKGETSVVSPPPDVICDQLICYSDSDVDFFKSKKIIEYISYSSLNDGKPVLTDDEVLRLTEALAEIKTYYFENIAGAAQKKAYRDYALDVEFKFEGPERQLYIKQVRPYND